MTYTNQSAATANTNTITAFFDSRTDADQAVERLVDAGISRSSVKLIEGGSDKTTSQSTASESTGFWASLENFFFPDEDRHTYAEGLRRGGYLVTVSGYAFDMHDIALDILDDEGSIDLDERAQAWESEGWSRTGNIETPAATRQRSDRDCAAVSSWRRRRRDHSGGPGRTSRRQARCQQRSCPGSFLRDRDPC